MIVRAAFTVAEVSQMFGVSESHIRKLLRDGTLQRVPHMGAAVRVSPDELQRAFGPLPASLAPEHDSPEAAMEATA